MYIHDVLPTDTGESSSFTNVRPDLISRLHRRVSVSFNQIFVEFILCIIYPAPRGFPPRTFSSRRFFSQPKPKLDSFSIRYPYSLFQLSVGRNVMKKHSQLEKTERERGRLCLHHPSLCSTFARVRYIFARPGEQYPLRLLSNNFFLMTF